MESEPSRLWIVREAFLFRRVQWRSYTSQGFAQYHSRQAAQLEEETRSSCHVRVV